MDEQVTCMVIYRYWGVLFVGHNIPTVEELGTLVLWHMRWSVCACVANMRLRALRVCA